MANCWKMLWTRSQLLSPTASANVAALVCAGAVLVKLLPHGFLLENYKDLYQAYRHLKPVPLTADSISCVDEVLQSMRVPDSDRRALRYFSVSTGDVLHAGSLHMRWGAVVGLPLTFAFRRASDVPNSGFSVYGHTVSWSSEPGQRLAESLVLSPAAQRFAIARETAATSCHHLFSETALLAVALITAFVVTATVNRRTSLRHAPRMYRLLSNSACCAVLGCVYVTLKDLVRCHLDRVVDERAARLGADYCRGGIEFYQQMLKRNSALRDIIGDCDSSTISLLGNLNFFVRTPCQPLTERLKRLKQVLRELSASAAAAGDDDGVEKAASDQEELATATEDQPHSGTSQ